MRQLRKYIYDVRPLDLLILLIWISNPLLIYTKIVLSHIPIIHTFAEYLIPVLYASLIILSASMLIKRIRLNDLIFFVLVFIVFLLHFVCYPNNIYMKEYFPEFLVSTLPMYFIGVSMKDIKKIFPHMEFFSYVAVICYFIFRKITSTDGDLNVSGGDMSGAYALLPFISFITWRIFEQNRKYLRVIVPIICLFIFLLLGNRGSMLCYIIFIILYLCLVKKVYKRYSIIAGIILILIAIIVFFNEIIIATALLSEEFGFSSRIIEKIIEGGMLDSSGRDSLIKTSLTAIAQQPLFGYGITGDRTILDSMYVHNIVLEFLIHYGCILGSILIIVCFAIIIKAYRRSNDMGLRSMLLILIICGLCPLFLSSTYLEWPKFFLLMGFSTYLAFRHH